MHKCNKVYEGYIEFDTVQKTSFSKESVEYADLYKPVLNKIMTIHEQCVKYDFVAPLTNILTTKIECLQYKSKGWTPGKNHCTIVTFVAAVKKDIECTKTIKPK